MAIEKVMPFVEDDDDREDEAIPAVSRELTVAEQREIAAHEREIVRIKVGKTYPRRPAVYDDDLSRTQDQQLLANLQALRTFGDLMPAVMDDYRKNVENSFAHLPLGMGKPVAAVVNTVDMLTRVGPQMRDANREAAATIAAVPAAFASERTASQARAFAASALDDEQLMALAVAKTQADAARLTRAVDYDLTEAAKAADHARAQEKMLVTHAHELELEQARTDRMVAKLRVFERATGRSSGAIETIREDVKDVSDAMAEFSLTAEQREGFAELANRALSRRVDATMRNEQKMVDMVMADDDEPRRSGRPGSGRRPASGDLDEE